MFKKPVAAIVYIVSLVGVTFVTMRSAEAASTVGDIQVVIDAGNLAAPNGIVIVPITLPQQAGIDLAQVINNDLMRTGQFRSLPRTQLPTSSWNLEDVNFEDWRKTGVNNLVVCQSHQNNDGTVGIRFTLLDVAKGVQLMAYDMPPALPGQLRYIGHMIADLIYQKMTGVTGAFTSKISYVSASSLGSSRTWELVVADADGDSPRAIATSPAPIMSPTWSPDRKQLAYVGFDQGSSAIYVQNLATGQTRKLVSEKGINAAPAWSPDGRSIAATLSLGTNPDIYVIDVETGARRRLTDYAGVDTEPSWSPDGRTLVFTSDRSGQPQIYQISAEGGEPKRLTFEGQQNLRARYAPDGRSLVLVTYRDKIFRIAILDLSKESTKIISSGPQDTSPTFSPNGVMVIYSTMMGQQSALATTSVDGGVKQLLRQQNHDIREPAWAPLSH